MSIAEFSRHKALVQTQLFMAALVAALLGITGGLFLVSTQLVTSEVVMPKVLLYCFAIMLIFAVLALNKSVSNTLVRKVTCYKILGTWKISALPSWTFLSKTFPEAKRLAARRNLSVVELECATVLAEEFDGTLNELFTLTKNVINQQKV